MNGTAHNIAAMLRSGGHVQILKNETGHWVALVGDLRDVELGPRAARWIDDYDTIVGAAVQANGLGLLDILDCA